MSAEVAEGPGRTVRNSWVADRFIASIAIIALLQAIWLWATISRGWYLQSDLSNLADTSHQSLTWPYLSRPLGGHFSPVLRAAYWLLQAVDPMSYGLTVVVRILLQTVAIALLGRLLYLLIGRSSTIPVVLAGYAMSSLTLPGVTFMTTGIAFGIAQALGLSALLALVRFARTGRVGDGTLVGLLVALATLASEQFIVYALLAALLAVGFCYTGTVKNRLRAALDSWLGWLAMAIPVLAVVVAALIGSDTKGAGGLRVGDIWPLLRTEWLRAFGPALVGGPFRWFGDDHTYAAFYAPADATVLLGQLAFALLVFLGWYLTGWRALIAWSLPILTGLVGILLVASARYGESGLLIPITPRYSFVIAAPLAIAVSLSLGSPGGTGRRLELRVPRRLAGAIPAAVLVGGALVIAMCISSVSYAHFWVRNPGRSYATTLAASVRAAGPSANLFDTPLPAGLVSSVEPNHHVSDLLRLLDVPAKFDQPNSAPMVVTPDGRLVKAAFLAATGAAGTQTPGCGMHLTGTGPFLIALAKPARPNEWFLRLELYQRAASTVNVQVQDRSGRWQSPTSGSTVQLPRLAVVNLRLPAMAPSKLKLTSTGPALDMCLVKALIGGPFAATGR
ncbi:MAG: hypothetical protein ABI140_00315 [Jatrophihabitantaceae bacterium]